MRVLSLLQPWGSLWVAGAKMIETRSWATKYRGRVAVHASAGFSRKLREQCYETPFGDELARLGFDSPADLPTGAILGWVTLTDCLAMVGRRLAIGPDEIEIGCDPRLTSTERAFGHYEVGRFAWVTSTDRVVLAEPIPFTGGLGLRHLAPELIAQIESAPPARPRW